MIESNVALVSQYTRVKYIGINALEDCVRHFRSGACEHWSHSDTGLGYGVGGYRVAALVVPTCDLEPLPFEAPRRDERRIGIGEYP